MSKITRILSICLALVFGFAVSAHALVSISVSDPGNSGITSMTYFQTGTTININEEWTVNAYGFLLISGLEEGTYYTINKYMTNSTGTDWVSFSNELLDPAGDENDSLDKVPQPSWLPDGYTTSNDKDGLSFAQRTGGQQGSDIPRESTVFNKLIVDEATHNRDFLDFYDGTISGDTGQDYPMSYGLSDWWGSNGSILLAQRPNEFTGIIPEPASMLLFSIGAIGFGAVLRKKRFKA